MFRKPDAACPGALLFRTIRRSYQSRGDALFEEVAAARLSGKYTDQIVCTQSTFSAHSPLGGCFFLSLQLLDISRIVVALQQPRSPVPPADGRFQASNAILARIVQHYGRIVLESNPQMP